MLIRPNCYRPIIAALAVVLVSGCASTPDEVLLPATPTPVQESSDSPVLLRQGRYTLAELRPDAGQHDLQLQIIDLRIPATVATTVGDAIRYVLRRSGYQLCEGDPALVTLWALPLPAAHMQLGPLPLNQTLQLLAGAAWHLSVDERTREVCFIAAPLNGELRP
ncbi:PFGI-1 class ICE element type IV pilus protein PilL2 [Pseudomonas lundensis]|uniref:PFGI-1 class ICE element type IV pilus protein PilL2 n=1 Tax=Pseudomonas lundensis TaxID=86185 RepID=UPI0039080CF9